jgi:hypothetical protein
MALLYNHTFKDKWRKATDSTEATLTAPPVALIDPPTLKPEAGSLGIGISESIKYSATVIAKVSDSTDASLTAPDVTVLDPATLTPAASNLGVSYSESVDFDLESVAAVSETTGASLTAPDVTVLSPSTIKPAASNLGISLSESVDVNVERVASVSESTAVSLTAPNVTVTDPAPIQPQASNLSVSYTESANANSTVPPYDRDFFITDLDAVSDQCVNGSCESIQKADDEVDMNASNAEGKQLEVTWSTGDYRSQNNSVSWTVRIKALDGSGSIIDSADFNGTTGNRNYVLSFTAPQGTQQIEVERFIQIIRRDSCRFDGDCARYEAHLLAPVSVTEV